MTTYIIRRLLLVIPTFIGISLLSFAIIQAAPGGPVYNMLRASQDGMSADAATREILEQTREQYGLNEPLPVQYGKWLWRLVTFDLGTSFEDNRPVSERIFEALPITLQLNIISIFLVYVIAVPIGVFSATHQRTWRDTIITVILFILYSLPSFWVAMLLMYFLGGGEWWDVFPVYGISSTGAENWPWYQWLGDRLWHIAMPVFCMTYGGLAGLSRYARTGMLDTIRQDYIRTARAYGFAERIVVFKYAMRNSLIPIITLLGTLLPALLGGSIIIESIFSIPGMGKLGFEAVLNRDYSLLMGIFAISSLLTLLGLLLSDIAYAIVDPRIRLK